MRNHDQGAVTIPQEIREELGLLPNTEVTFDIVDGEARLRRHAEKAGSPRRPRGRPPPEVRPSNKLTYRRDHGV